MTQQPKKIKKIEKLLPVEDRPPKGFKGAYQVSYTYPHPLAILSKINEIIDYLNEKK